MILRKSTEEDIAGIVEVLKLSLGEKDLPLSEEIWKYKHIDNPFGPSLVLVALENKQIIGVRAFMRWRWKSGNSTYNALRAVDTATHPDHQGKGVFKRLTLEAVQLAREGGDHFIFNTPNDNSRPGYLKMGWKVVDKIPVGIKPSLSWLNLNSQNQNRKRERPEVHLNEEIDLLCSQWNSSLKGKNKLFTPKSLEYLKWRYLENPLQDYEVIVAQDLFIAVYIKRRGRIAEMRIAEAIYRNETAVKKEVKKRIHQLSSRLRPHFISYSPGLLSLGVLTISGKLGPVLTVRNLNLDQENITSKCDHWNSSLGDLELF